MEKNRKENPEILYNDRYKFAFDFYVPLMKDPLLEIIEKSKKINLTKTKKIKPVPYESLKIRESPSDFLKRKKMETEIDLIRDKCEKARESFKRIRDFEFNRHEMMFPRYKNTVNGRTVDEIIEKVDHVYEKYLYPSDINKGHNKNNENLSEHANSRVSVIKDIHRSFEFKIEKRREFALHEMKSYLDSGKNIQKRIQNFSNTFEGTSADD